MLHDNRLDITILQGNHGISGTLSKSITVPLLDGRDMVMKPGG
jgi:hypothetical protein